MNEVSNANDLRASILKLNEATPAELLDDRLFVIVAVHFQGHQLKYAPLKFRKDLEVCLAAVDNCGLALQWAEPELHQEEALVFRAAMRDKRVLTWEREAGIVKRRFEGVKGILNLPRIKYPLNTSMLLSFAARRPEFRNWRPGDLQNALRGAKKLKGFCPNVPQPTEIATPCGERYRSPGRSRSPRGSSIHEELGAGVEEQERTAVGAGSAAVSGSARGKTCPEKPQAKEAKEAFAKLPPWRQEKGFKAFKAERQQRAETKEDPERPCKREFVSYQHKGGGPSQRRVAMVEIKEDLERSNKRMRHTQEESQGRASEEVEVPPSFTMKGETIKQESTSGSGGECNGRPPWRTL